MAVFSAFLAFSFFAGALPFSVWLGRLFLSADIRAYGADNNPGAANAWRAGRWQLGLPVLLLDFLKGALPAWLAAQQFAFTGWQLVFIALAPIVGHIFSPLLRFRGGKGLAVTFGVWTGLAPPAAPLVLGLAFILAYFSLDRGARSALAGMLALPIYGLFSGAPAILFPVWLGNILLLLWSHRRELSNRQPAPLDRESTPQ